MTKRSRPAEHALKLALVPATGEMPVCPLTMGNAIAHVARLLPFTHVQQR